MMYPVGQYLPNLLFPTLSVPCMASLGVHSIQGINKFQHMLEFQLPFCPSQYSHYDLKFTVAGISMSLHNE